jgi:hypothetical protein
MYLSRLKLRRPGLPVCLIPMHATWPELTGSLLMARGCCAAVAALSRRMKQGIQGTRAGQCLLALLLPCCLHVQLHVFMWEDACAS